MDNKSWSLYNPVRVRFGSGCRTELKDVLKGKKITLITTRGGLGRIKKDPELMWLASAKGVRCIDTVSANPDVDELEEMAALVGDYPALFLAVGGGSVIDTAKALALRCAPGHDMDLRRMLEVGCHGGNGAKAPVFAVPTTAGTGSEVTPFATIWDRKKRRKHSLEGDAVFPERAWVDPELTLDLPWDITLTTGLDALNQGFESYWSRNANPITMAWAARSIKLSMRALPRLKKDQGDRAARVLASESSLLAGLAISQTRTGLCHSISYPMTAHFGVPHGLACAFSMLAVLRLNLGADDGRFEALARELDTGDPRGLVDELASLLGALGVAARVREMIGDRSRLLSLADEMLTPGRADTNLVSVKPEDLERIVQESWEGR